VRPRGHQQVARVNKSLRDGPHMLPENEELSAGRVTRVETNGHLVYMYVCVCVCVCVCVYTHTYGYIYM
jgi:hypothetical protein